VRAERAGIRTERLEADDCARTDRITVGIDRFDDNRLRQHFARHAGLRVAGHQTQRCDRTRGPDRRELYRLRDALHARANAVAPCGPPGGPYGLGATVRIGRCHRRRDRAAALSDRERDRGAGLRGVAVAVRDAHGESCGERGSGDCGLRVAGGDLDAGGRPGRWRTTGSAATPR